MADPAAMFDFTSMLANIPIIGKLFESGTGTMPFEGFINSLSSMSQLDMMGLIGAGFAVLAVAAYSEMFMRSMWPQPRRMGR